MSSSAFATRVRAARLSPRSSSRSCSPSSLIAARTRRRRARSRKIAEGADRSVGARARRQLPAHRLRLARVRRQLAGRAGTSAASRARPANAPTRSWSPTSTRDGQRRARVVPARPLGRDPGHRARQDQRRVQRRPATRDRDDRAGLRRSDQPLPRGRLRGLPQHRERARDVPIYFPTPARDLKSGLYSTKAGCQHLNGDAGARVRALAVLRVVHERAVELRPASDLGRIKRQQYFLRTLAQQALHTASRSPWKANDLVDKLLANLTRDPKLSFVVVACARVRVPQRPAGVETLTLPTQPPVLRRPGRARARRRQGRADARPPAWHRTRRSSPASAGRLGLGRPPQIACTSRCENGSGRDGSSARVPPTRCEGSASRSPVPATNADRSDYTVTEVRYATGRRDARPARARRRSAARASSSRSSAPLRAAPTSCWCSGATTQVVGAHRDNARSHRRRPARAPSTAAAGAGCCVDGHPAAGC